MNAKKDFLRSYETVAPMVVPRSAVEVDHDDEFILYAVATFKKHGADFVQKCREQKWTPRQYTHVEGGREEEQRELDRVTNEERKVCGEALRIGRTGWSESVMIWFHVLTLRVFVEAVLRYGLPLDYVTALIKVCKTRCSFLLRASLVYSTTNSEGTTDDAKDVRQSEDGTRRQLFVLGRKCLWPRQEGQGHKG